MVNSAVLTSLTLQKKEVEVHAQKAHTARCALKAVMAGKAHGETSLTARLLQAMG